MSPRLSLNFEISSSSQRIQVLVGGLLTGAAAATFPACGNILTDPGLFGFSSTQFGSLFVVQTLSAIASALFSPRLRKVTPLSRLSQTGLISTALAMVLLTLIELMSSSSNWPYVMALASSFVMGIGIGLGISVANVNAATAWPDNPRRGLTLLHTLLGLGLATSPVLVSLSISVSHWWITPLLVGVGALTLASFVKPISRAVEGDAGDGHSILTTAERQFVLRLGSLAMLYGVSEATFSNWCVIYLHEVSEVGLATAGLVLSGFWLAVMFGRLSFSTVTPSRGRWISIISPIVMIVAFGLIALSNSVVFQISGYLIAGLGCAAVYPALLGLSAQLPSRHSQFVSGVMVATVLAGTGLGTYAVALLNRWCGLGLDQIYLTVAIIPVVLLVGLWRSKPQDIEPAPQSKSTSSTFA